MSKEDSAFGVLWSQGGTDAGDVEAWRSSWQLPLIAAQTQLLIAKVSPQAGGALLHPQGN